jgi:MoxR-like ATPase
MSLQQAALDPNAALVDAANEVPASAMIRSSSLPEPAEALGPPPALLAASEQLNSLLPKALQSLSGKTLAEFEWQTVTGKEGDASVSVVGVDGAAFELSWMHAGGEQRVRVKAEIYCEGDELILRLRVGRKLRAWCMTTSALLESWLGGAPTASQLPNPRGASGLEYLGHVWFSDADGHDSGVRNRTRRRAWRLPSVGRAWPTFRLKNTRRVWEVPLLPRMEGECASDDLGGLVAAFALWSFLTHLFQEANDDDTLGSEAFGLPQQREYFPQRAVNLNGSQVLAQLRQDAYRLRLPWHVIEAACASLNSGKHVLFTGPPGCGKSKLAIALAELATTRKPLLVTASPAWTSGDLIGRYLPSRTGQGLTFVPGSFLRAADQERWLVVDEFNRANIDECFGELFSVLANDIVELPFEERIPDEQAGTTERFAPVRIVPAIRASEAAATEDTYRDYQVSPSFRLIGTMNDADRSRLHQLSFALQRRFDVIRVEAPPWNVVREVIKEEKQRLEKTLRHSYRFFQRTAQRIMERRLDFEELEKDIFHALFAADPTDHRRGEVIDLVSERVIGLATVRDVMSFVAEGLRGPVGQLGHASVLLPESMTTHDVAMSYVAMGLVLSVFPQLEAVEPGRQIAVIRFIVDRFRDASGNSLPLLRLTTVENGDEPFTVERVRASDAHAVDQDADSWISVPEYMISELIRQFKGSIAEQDLLDIIRREPQPASDA